MDLKLNLVHLLCLCNYSLKNPLCHVQLKLQKAMLTNSIDYQKKAIGSCNKGILSMQSIYHDLKTISQDMTFNMKQFPNVLAKVKKCIKQKKLLYIRPEELELFKEEHGIESFEMTIFYHFEKVLPNNAEISVIRPKSKTHNVFIVNSNNHVMLLYNPFQHSFKK